MKDSLKRNKFWNSPMKNPTQNMFRRFMKTPKGKMTSQFQQLGEEFKKNRFDLNKFE